MKIYLLQASFADWEYSSTVDIGVYDSLDEASKIYKKWDNFFIQNKYLVEKPGNLDSLDESGKSIDYDEVENKWIRLSTIYQPIRDYIGLDIKEMEFGKDSFIDKFVHDSEEFNQLLKQWDRDYKIESIIE